MIELDVSKQVRWKDIVEEGHIGIHSQGTLLLLINGAGSSSDVG